MEVFNFRFQNNKSNKYLWYGLLSFFGGLGLSIALMIIFDLDSLFLFFTTIILSIGGFILGLRKYLIHSKSNDKITLQEDGFHSEYHGYVSFSDIESIADFGIFQAPPPSMKIRLRSGEKIVWFLSPTKTKFNSEEDAETFKSFTVALGDHLAKYEQKQVSKPIVNVDHTDLNSEMSIPSDNSEAAVETTTSDAIYTHEKLSDQVKNVHKRHNRAVWTIPFGLVLALISFTRGCGADYFKNKRQQEFQQIFAGSHQRYNQLLEKSRQVMDDYVPNLGPVYVFSNDPEIEIALVPDIMEDETYGNLPATLAYSSQGQYLRDFINNPENAEYLTVFIHPDNELQFTGKSRFNMLDSTETWLYLRFYDINHLVNPDPYLIADSTMFSPLDIRTGVAIYEGQSIKESLENSILGLPMMLAQAKHSESFKIYLTGAEKDQVSEALFEDVRKELNALLFGVDVDTLDFQTKIFNLKEQ